MLYEYTSIVTILTIFLVIGFMFRTGLGRGKYKVNAPAMSGEKTWDKLFRIHANTVEQAVIFFPALWLAAVTAGDTIAAGIGAIWLLGRIIYYVSYLKDPKTRGPGMLMTFGSTAVLAGIALFYIVRGMMG